MEVNLGKIKEAQEKHRTRLGARRFERRDAANVPSTILFDDTSTCLEGVALADLDGNLGLLVEAHLEGDGLALAGCRRLGCRLGQLRLGLPIHMSM